MAKIIGIDLGTTFKTRSMIYDLGFKNYSRKSLFINLKSGQIKEGVQS